MKSAQPSIAAVELDEIDGFPRVTLYGECSSDTARQLQKRLDALIGSGRLFILLDTRDVSYLDPNCHRILSEAIERVRAAGGSFVVVDQSPPVERTLKLLNLEQLSRVVPTTSQATTYLRWAH